MSTLSILLVLLSAIIHIGWNTLTKSSTNPRVFSLFKGTVLLFFTLILSFNFDLTLIPRDLWIISIASGIVHFVYILGLSSAYEQGDISYVYPIVRSAPAFVPLAAFIVFAERISLRGGIGITIVVLSVFALLLWGKVGKGESLVRIVFRKENIWAFITLGTVVTYSIVDKAGMLSMHEVQGLSTGMQAVVYFLLQTSVCYLIYWSFMIRKRGIIQLSVLKKEWIKILLAALGTMTSYALILHVMQSEKLSYIVTLRQSSILFAVVIGWFYFREAHFRVRFLISLCMVLGLYLTATA
jgi:drug/metabolite transporter (DMT)-like permease